tara:strand:+ start:1292 stop:1447 length:156 start_codon:yes stop_codon:yes gene_type:complete
MGMLQFYVHKLSYWCCLEIGKLIISRLLKLGSTELLAAIQLCKNKKKKYMS